jgi:hypothetical protein
MKGGRKFAQVVTQQKRYVIHSWASQAKSRAQTCRTAASRFRRAMGRWYEDRWRRGEMKEVANIRCTAQRRLTMTCDATRI